MYTSDFFEKTGKWCSDCSSFSDFKQQRNFQLADRTLPIPTRALRLLSNELSSRESAATRDLRLLLRTQCGDTSELPTIRPCRAFQVGIGGSRGLQAPENRRVASVWVNFSNLDEGAPGPSHLGTGETANPNQSAPKLLTYRDYHRQPVSYRLINIPPHPHLREAPPATTLRTPRKHLSIPQPSQIRINPYPLNYLRRHPVCVPLLSN
jgi:hypothetical protein